MNGMDDASLLEYYTLIDHLEVVLYWRIVSKTVGFELRRTKGTNVMVYK